MFSLLVESARCLLVVGRRLRWRLCLQLPRWPLRQHLPLQLLHHLGLLALKLQQLHLRPLPFQSDPPQLRRPPRQLRSHLPQSLVPSLVRTNVGRQLRLGLLSILLGWQPHHLHQSRREWTQRASRHLCQRRSLVLNVRLARTNSKLKLRHRLLSSLRRLHLYRRCRRQSRRAFLWTTTAAAKHQQSLRTRRVFSTKWRSLLHVERRLPAAWV